MTGTQSRAYLGGLTNRTDDISTLQNEEVLRITAMEQGPILPCYFFPAMCLKENHITT